MNLGPLFLFHFLGLAHMMVFFFENFEFVLQQLDVVAACLVATGTEGIVMRNWSNIEGFGLLRLEILEIKILMIFIFIYQHYSYLVIISFVIEQF
jgi:hypothetical protein